MLVKNLSGLVLVIKKALFHHRKEMGLWVKMSAVDTLEINGLPSDSTTIPLYTE